MNTSDDSSELSPSRRPVGALPVCARLPLLGTREARSLVWFLQSLSHEQGGLGRVAHAVIEAFPDRMAAAGSHHELAALHRSLIFAESIRRDPNLREFMEDEQGTQDTFPGMTTDELRDECRKTAVARMAETLREFCTARRYYIPGGLKQARSAAVESYGSGDFCALQPLELPWFRDLSDALFEYQRSYAEGIRREFYLTNIGRAVWAALDRCADTGGTVIVGETGRGKSTAARAWCDAHRGDARFVTLPGSGESLAVFRAIATALGIGATYSQGVRVLREKVADVLRKSRLMLVIDEAHFLLPHRSRRGRPELLDWLDVALHEDGVPVCLIATPQFAHGMADLERREGWNLQQFRRRFSRWVELDTDTDLVDMVKLAERHFPMAGRKAAELAASYAMERRDVSGLGDLVKACVYRARLDGRSEPNEKDVRAAFEDQRASDQAMETAFGNRRSRGNTRPTQSPHAISTHHFAEGAPVGGAESAAVPPCRRGGLPDDFQSPHPEPDLGCMAI